MGPEPFAGKGRLAHQKAEPGAKGHYDESRLD